MLMLFLMDRDIVGKQEYLIESSVSIVLIVFVVLIVCVVLIVRIVNAI